MSCNELRDTSYDLAHIEHKIKVRSFSINPMGGQYQVEPDFIDGYRRPVTGDAQPVPNFNLKLSCFQ
jgi:hypothetical protein